MGITAVASPFAVCSNELSWLYCKKAFALCTVLIHCSHDMAQHTQHDLHIPVGSLYLQIVLAVCAEVAAHSSICLMCKFGLQAHPE